MKNYIKSVRERIGRTQKECADQFGVTLRAWQSYEQGISEPKYELLCRIADFFNVTTDYLLGREEQPNPLSMLTVNLDNVDITAEEVFKKYELMPPEIKAVIIEVLMLLGDAAKQSQEQQKKKHSVRTGDLIDEEQAEETDAV